jgi:hypothetical protein
MNIYMWIDDLPGTSKRYTTLAITSSTRRWVCGTASNFDFGTIDGSFLYHVVYTYGVASK